MLPVPDVAERTGLTVLQVRQLLKDGHVLGVRREDGILVLGIDQFDGPGPVKSLPAVLTLLKDARFSEQAAWEWLITPDDTLPGTPLQALQENRGTEVKRRAQAEG